MGVPVGVGEAGSAQQVRPVEQPVDIIVGGDSPVGPENHCPLA